MDGAAHTSGGVGGFFVNLGRLIKFWPTGIYKFWCATGNLFSVSALGGAKN